MNDQNDEHHKPASLSEDREIGRLVDFLDEAVLLMEGNPIDSDFDRIEDKPREYFEELVRKAAFSAAQQYEKRREPVPPLVISALRAGEPNSLACERADGDLIEAQLDRLNQREGARADSVIN
jgi:hypothetical protein